MKSKIIRDGSGYGYGNGSGYGYGDGYGDGANIPDGLIVDMSNDLTAMVNNIALLNLLKEPNETHTRTA